MKVLLEKYNAMNNVKIEDIIELHAKFEYIHPFQDDHVIIRTKLEKPSKINGFLKFVIV